MPLVPWRLAWAAQAMADAETRRRYFRVTAAHGRAGALGLFASCLAMRPSAAQTRERPVRLTVEGVGVIPLHSFSDFFIFFEVFVLEHYEVAQAAPPALIVDIGANTGMFVLYARRRHPRARIVGYEPLPLNFERLRRNVEDNRLENVRLENKGVGGTARRATLHLHPSNTGGHSLISESLPGSSEAVEVEIAAIAEVVEAAVAEAGAPIDLMKIDCEGAEHEIIMAMTEAQARQVRRMVIEPSFRLYDRSAFLGRLAELGYRCRTHGDLIVAEQTESAAAPAPEPAAREALDYTAAP